MNKQDKSKRPMNEHIPRVMQEGIDKPENVNTRWILVILLITGVIALTTYILW